ncbi:MAG: hypothetical protein IJE79_04690 [Alphaproteobacteria bacterium]|nr:hypothetical protein [Alphaproteobacteria bacterium]
MRKYFFMIFATFFAGNLWAACQPTTNVLENRSEPDHDEYLYENTREREIRQNKGQGEAYLCGYEDKGGCPRGERFAFRNAAVGADNYTGLTVYTCAGGGDNYFWEAVTVEEKCYSDERVYSESVGGMTLYKLGNNKYCEHVVYLKDLIRAIADDAIANNNDTLLEQFWEELNTKIENIYRSDAFMNAVVNVVNGMDKPLSEDNLNTIIGLITQGIQNSGFADKIGDIQSDIEGIKDRISNLEVNVTQLKTDLKNTTDSLFKLAVKYDVTVTKIQAEFDEFWEQLNARMTKEEIEEFVNEKIATLEEMLMYLIQDQGRDLDNFKNEVATIHEVLQIKLNEHGIKIAELDSRIAALEGRMEVAEDNIARLREGLNQAVTKIHELAAEYGVSLIKTEAEFKKVWAELGNKMNKDDVEELVKTYIINSEQIIMQEIQNTNFDLDEFKKKVAEIETDLRDELEKHGIKIAELDSRIDALENRVGAIEGDVTDLKTGLKNTADSLFALAVKYDAKVTEIQTEFEKVWAELGNKMNKDDVEKLVKTYIIDLEQKIMQEIQNTNVDLDEFKKKVADIEKKLQDKLEEHGIKITELDKRITELETRVGAIEVNVTELKTDLKNTTNSLLVLATKYDVKVAEIEAEFENVWEQLKATMTKEEIEEFVNEQIAALEEKLMEQINKQGKDLENFKNEVKKIENDLKDRLNKIDIRLDGLESRINDLEVAKEDIISKLEKLAETDEELKKAIEALKADLANKVTMEEVIVEITNRLENAELNNNQRKQVIELIETYTVQLSDGQRQQVEIMIQQKIGKKFDELDATNKLQDEQRKSQDRVNSAMSVLNAFAAGQDASVWRNADGKFNTARLASDATAGVILGTAGGLISNKVIKKNQIKKGFEGIGCYVGGQVVADYGDEFTVGMM